MSMQVVVLLFGVILLHCPSSEAARKPSEWATMTDEQWEEIGAQWDEDDDPEERKIEDQFEYERVMRAKEQGVPVGIDLNNPDEYFAASQSMGHTMMFTSIQKGHNLKDLAYKWREQLFLGGIEVTCYDIDDTTLLVTLQRGWNGIQLKDFLIDQVEVQEVKWQDKTFRGKHAKRKKRSSKRRKKNKKKNKKGGKKKNAKASDVPSSAGTRKQREL